MALAPAVEDISKHAARMFLRIDLWPLLVFDIAGPSPKEIERRGA
jgi:hypothetical protein